MQKKLFPWWLVLIAPIIMALSIYAMTGRARALLLVVMTPMMAIGNYINQHRQAGAKQDHEIELFERQFEKLEEVFYRSKPEEELRATRRSRRSPRSSSRRCSSVRGCGPGVPSTGTSCRYVSAPPRPVAQLDRGAGHPERPARLHRADRPPEGALQVRRRRTAAGIAPRGGFRGVAEPARRRRDAWARGAALRSACAQRGRHRRLRRPGLGRGARVAQVAAAHHLGDQPVQGHAAGRHRADGRCPAQRAGGIHHARRPDRGTPRPVRREVEPDAERHRRRPGRGGDQRAMQVSIVVFVIQRCSGRPGAAGPGARARRRRRRLRGLLSSTVEALPAVCRTYLDVSDGLERADRRARAQRRDSTRMSSSRASRTPTWTCSPSGSRRWSTPAPSSPTPATSPTRSASCRLLGHELAEDPHAVVERWRQNNSIIDRLATGRGRGSKKAGNAARHHRPGGLGRDDLDLRTQGPHALVGGTTGAGKCEFLQAWVLGMAAEYSPDRVTFLFVDYKGGSAFADCVDAAALRRPGHRPEPAPRTPRAHQPRGRAAPPGAPVQPQEGQGPARAREARRPRVPARARDRRRRVRRTRRRGARVRRRRRRHRPARPFARAST